MSPTGHGRCWDVSGLTVNVAVSSGQNKVMTPDNVDNSIKTKKCKMYIATMNSHKSELQIVF